MDPAKKRRLKKLGKRLVEQQSRELQEHLREANPAPVGSDEWAANYTAGVAHERALRKAPPDRMSESEAAAEYILVPVDMGDRFIGVPTWYVQCSKCRDLLDSVPSAPVCCACGALRLSTSDGFPVLQSRFSADAQPCVLRLMGRGVTPRKESVRRPWWRFW